MVRDQVGNEIRYGYGGAIYHGASDAAVNESKVVSMSLDLIDYLKQAQKECKESGLNADSSSDPIISNQNDKSRREGAIDAEYLDKLVSFATVVKEQPFPGDARYY